ncbi:MAG TPA: HpsJ family protein, partial [Allocoleopsis sp.]
MNASSRSSSTTAKMLNFVGVILVVSSLLDYIVLLIPPAQPSNATPEQWGPAFLQWQQTVTAQLIDRGVTPMLGLAILFVAFWINRQSEGYSPSSFENIQKLSCIILAALLGITFIVVPALNVLSLQKINNQALEKIKTEATQAETVVKGESDRVNNLLKDQAKLAELDQAIKSGKVPANQLEQLKAIQTKLSQFKQDPKSLQKQVDEAQTKIKSSKLEAEKRAQSDFIKSAARNGISGLLLA